MPNITSDQALQIARTFSGFASTVQNYRFDHFDDLSDLQEANLRNVENSLRTISDNYIDKGINMVLDNIQGALDGLGQVTKLVNTDVKKLDDVNKALQVITVLVQLGAAFATGNPVGIASAIGSSISALSSKSNTSGASAD